MAEAPLQSAWDRWPKAVFLQGIAALFLTATAGRSSALLRPNNAKPRPAPDMRQQDHVALTAIAALAARSERPVAGPARGLMGASGNPSVTG
jgi:hypothetical protein